MSLRRLGVLGGTFDPPHIAHLFVAEEVRSALALERVVFVPAQQSPLKPQPSASATDRLAMVRLAVADNPHLEVSTVDLDRPAPSYTVDTLELLRESLPADAQLHLILGADQLRDLPRWRDPQRLFELSRVVAVSRPGHPRDLPPDIARAVPAAAGRVQYLETIHLEVSSRDIRCRIVEGRSVRYLVPEAVRVYIEAHRLYRDRRV